MYAKYAVKYSVWSSIWLLPHIHSGLVQVEEPSANWAAVDIKVYPALAAAALVAAVAQSCWVKATRACKPKTTLKFKFDLSSSNEIPIFEKLLAKDKKLYIKFLKKIKKNKKYCDCYH